MNDKMSSHDDHTDIRFEAPNDLAAVIAALAKGRRMTRNELILKLMHEYADAECKVHSVLVEAAERNPVLSERLGRRK